MKEMMILLIIRLANQKYTNDNWKAIIEGIERTIDIVEQLSKNGNIIGVVEFSSMIKRKDYNGIEEWTYVLRVIGTKIKKVQVFFIV